MLKNHCFLISSINRRLTGQKKRCINLGSYNYLGFAENTGPRIELVKDSITHYGCGTGSPRQELGKLMEKSVGRIRGALPIYTLVR